MKQDKTHYETLGVPPAVSPEALRAAYLELARKHHPDTGCETHRFAEITEAYAVLRDPARRRDYDATVKLLMRACPECDGVGVTRRTKGFTRVVETPCKSCQGRGRV
jgi:DnaJ-class molecular chaperone